MNLIKDWRKLIKIIATILLIITVFNFLCAIGITPVNAAGEVDYEGNSILGEIADGIVGFITLPFKFLIIFIGSGIDILTRLLIGEGKDVDVETILFNNIEVTLVDFFSKNNSDEMIQAIRANVANWYVAMRNIAIAVLIIICIYVGIRMAIATVADEKAQYKRMLMDWLASLALVFVIHYIMVGIIQINNVLVKAIEGAMVTEDRLTVGDISDSFRSDAIWTISFIRGTTNAIIYFSLQLMTITILLMYIKRMITVAFLMILAPLVSITYSIDKMGDGKAQALNTWLKEFSYTILIQPFHCLAFAALGGIAKEISNNLDGLDVRAAIFSILLITFILQSEKIVKKIFHFESSSLQDVLASAAIASTFMDKGRGLAKGTAKAAGEVKELKNNMPMIKDRLKKGSKSETDNKQKENKEPPEKKKQQEEKPVNYDQMTNTEKQEIIKNLKKQKFRLQTGATNKKELLLRGALAANKIGFSTALGIGIGASTGSDQAVMTKGFQDFTNSTMDAMKKGKEFSQGRVKHEVAKAYNTAREEIMEKVKEQYMQSERSKGKNDLEQQRDIEEMFDDRMKGLLTGKTDLDTASQEEKELAHLLKEMHGSLIMDGQESNAAIEGCLSLLKEIEAGEVGEVWSGERLKGTMAIPTYFFGDRYGGNATRRYEELKEKYNKYTDFDFDPNDPNNPEDKA